VFLTFYFVVQHFGHINDIFFKRKCPSQICIDKIQLLLITFYFVDLVDFEFQPEWGKIFEKCVLSHRVKYSYFHLLFYLLKISWRWFIDNVEPTNFQCLGK